MAQSTLIAIVTTHPATFWKASAGRQVNYKGLKGSDGDWYYTEKDEIRLWRTEGGAVRWFKRTVDKYPGMRGVVTKIDGTIVEVGPEAVDHTLPPHLWEKQNLVTIMARGGGGSYDVWRCSACKKQVKRWGLSGRPSGGHCPARKTE